jgi:hypothetical protein
MSSILLGDYTEIRTLEKHILKGIPEGICIAPQTFFFKDSAPYLPTKNILSDKANNRIRFITATNFSIEIRENQVILACPQLKSRTFDDLVYGIVDNVVKATHLKQYKIPEFSGEYLLESYYGLKSIKYETYVHRDIIL